MTASVSVPKMTCWLVGVSVWSVDDQDTRNGAAGHQMTTEAVLVILDQLH